MLSLPRGPWWAIAVGWLLLGGLGSLLIWLGSAERVPVVVRIGASLLGVAVALVLVSVVMATSRLVRRIGLKRLGWVTGFLLIAGGLLAVHKRQYAEAAAQCRQAASARTVAAREQALRDGESLRAAAWLLLPERVLDEHSGWRCAEAGKELERLKLAGLCPQTIPDDAECECGKERWPKTRPAAHAPGRPMCTPDGIRFGH